MAILFIQVKIDRKVLYYPIGAKESFIDMEMINQKNHSISLFGHFNNNSFPCHQFVSLLAKITHSLLLSSTSHSL
jgi:hypothetical protein